MGHVGIIAGLIAVGIGLIILLWLPMLYNSPHHRRQVMGGILTPILGHAGAIFGALIVGSLGLILCYLAGIWLLIIFLREYTPSKEL